LGLSIEGFKGYNKGQKGRYKMKKAVILLYNRDANVFLPHNETAHRVAKLMGKLVFENADLKTISVLGFRIEWL
jgi:hypothetical protein